MSEDGKEAEKSKEESLRVQLTEMNNRSRWYSAELWQVPFAYLGLTGLIIVQLADKAPKHLGPAFMAAAAFGVFVILHMNKIRKNERRAVKNLRDTEIALKLSPTAKSSPGPTIFQVAISLTVLAYSLSGLYLCFKEYSDKSPIQQSATIEIINTEEKLSLPKDKIAFIINAISNLQKDIKDMKMEKYWSTILAGIFGLLGVILGFFLQMLSNRLSERKLVRKEFAEIKNSIYATTITNNIFPQLLLFKQFIIRHAELLTKKGINDFYQKWLTEPLVEESFKGVGYWTQEKVEKMHRDLDKTEI